jgi:hypothetical protein
MQETRGSHPCQPTQSILSEPYILYTNAHVATNPMVPVAQEVSNSYITRNRRTKLTSQDKPQCTNQRTVPQIQHPRSPRREAQSPDPIKHGIQKHINGRSARSEKRSPLPMVVFRTERKVDHKDRDGGRSHDHQTVAEEQEAEHVVDTAEPDAADDEVQLEEYGAKGKDADEEHGGQGT